MAKPKSQYCCQNCQYLCAKWLGKCPSCGAWSSFAEASSSEAVSTWIALDDEIKPLEAFKRWSTGILELDRVLGGGMITDGFTLLGGDPGIGKSTLLLQMAQGLILKQPQLQVLYVSAEESLGQIQGRAYRLGIQGHQRIFLTAETVLEKAFTTIESLKPQVVIMDSLQTLSTSSSTSSPGSMTQVRDIATELMALAKSSHLAIWLVGHVTKEGNFAGPKTIEHMVDTVLYFEGEPGQNYRLLRSVKNRFGNTRELAVFEMQSEGLKEVDNPSSLFLSDRKQAVSGTAVACPIEGSRPLLVEIQALVTGSALAMPRRTAVGMDHTRVSLLAAILEKHLRLPLAERDLFFNVTGGFRLVEPACDLAAAAAILSSTTQNPFPLGWVFIGEVGLTGEIRRVSQLENRVQEAQRLGFHTVVLPQAGCPSSVQKMQLRPLSHIQELIQWNT